MKHKVKNIHFVGVGGAGMSGIAEVLANQGFKVSGSDLADNATTRRLKTLGVTVMQGHDEAHVATAHERAQGSACLVVRRMRLVGKPR